jgi:hypothetical protein
VTNRRDLVGELEEPIRLLAQSWDCSQQAPVGQINTILSEIDKIDAIAAAVARNQARINARLGQLRLSLAEDAPPGSTCRGDVYEGDSFHRRRRDCGHAAKKVVHDEGSSFAIAYCGTHLKRKLDNAVDRAFQKLEKERKEHGEITDDERLIDADREARWGAFLRA